MKNGKKLLKILVTVIVAALLLNLGSCIFPTSDNSLEGGVSVAFFDLDDGVWDKERVESAITLIANNGAAVFSGNLTEEIIRYIRNTLEYWQGKIALDFRECTGLDSLPGSAFGYCKNLTSIMLPSSLTYIGWDAFRGCCRLTEITIPLKVTSFGERVFSGCSSLTALTLPSSVTTIGHGMFEGFYGLTNLTIPSSVTTIESFAFDSCSSLKVLTIPSSVTNIERFAFSGCTTLTAITIDIGNEQYKDINGVLFSKDGKTLVYYPQGKKEETYEIPSSVTSIGSSAFSGCSGLTAITIPSSVKTIMSHAFSGCSGLTAITIPSGVTNIEELVFLGCRSLTSVIIENGVADIGSGVFSRCSALTEITISGSVKNIGVGAFVGCDNLTSITVDVDNGYYKDLDGVLFSKDGKMLISYPAAQNETSYEIPFGVTSIMKGAFYGCKWLTALTIPSSVTSIENMAIYECSNLKVLTIPSSVTSINTDAIYCSSIDTVNYTGTEDEWKALTIGVYNNNLLNAAVNYNYSM